MNNQSTNEKKDILDRIPVVDKSENVTNARSEAMQHFAELEKAMQSQIKQYEHDVSGNLTPDEQKKLKNNPGIASDYLFMKSMPKLLAEHEQAQLERNRCTKSEYQGKWILLHQLFEHSGYATEKEFHEARRVLSIEYLDRFSPQHPVTIVDDTDNTKVLATIPPVYRPLNMIRGDGAWAIDAFSSYGAHDRPDISRAVNADLIQSAINAQKLPKKEFEAIRANTGAQALEVLKTLNPEHPIFEKLSELKKDETKTENKPVQKENSQLSQTVSSDANILEVNDDDLGL